MLLSHQGLWALNSHNKSRSSLLLLQIQLLEEKNPASDHICFALPFYRTTGFCFSPSDDGKCCQWISAEKEGKPHTEGSRGHRQCVNISKVLLSLSDISQLTSSQKDAGIVTISYADISDTAELLRVRNNKWDVYKTTVVIVGFNLSFTVILEGSGLVHVLGFYTECCLTSSDTVWTVIPD